MRYPMMRTWFRRAMDPLYAPPMTEAPHGSLKEDPVVADWVPGVGNVAPSRSPEDP